MQERRDRRIQKRQCCQEFSSVEGAYLLGIDSGSGSGSVRIPNKRRGGGEKMKLNIITSPSVELLSAGGYPYFILGDKTLWVSRKISRPGEKLPFPLLSAKMFRTQQGNWIIHSVPWWTTYVVLIPHKVELKIETKEEEIISLPISYGRGKGVFISAPTLGKVVIEFSIKGKTQPNWGIVQLLGGEARVFPGITYNAWEDIELEMDTPPNREGGSYVHSGK